MPTRIVSPGSTSQTIAVDALSSTGAAVVLTSASAGLTLTVQQTLNGIVSTVATLTPTTRTNSGQWGPAGAVANIGGTQRTEIDLPDSAFVGSMGVISIALVATGVKLAISETVQIAVLAPSIAINTTQAQAAISPFAIPIIRGDFLSVALPTMGNISTRIKLVVTCKTLAQTLSTTNNDSQSLFQISESGGLIVFNGSSTGFSSSDGNLNVTNATTGAVNLTLNATETAQFPLEDVVLDAQWWDSNGPHTPIFCTASITADVTQSTT